MLQAQQICDVFAKSEKVQNKLLIRGEKDFTRQQVYWAQ